MPVVQVAANLHSLYPMSVNLAQYRGTVGSFNSCNIATKIMYSLITCRFFHKLNRNMIFFAVTLFWYWTTLILSVSSALLNNLHTQIKTIYWSVLITFLILIVIMFIQSIWVHALLIKLSGDIEMNPGPKPNPCHSFSICHWKLNSLTAHNYLKYHFYGHMLLLRNLLLYDYQRPFLIHLTYLMMTVLTFLVIT